jgi:hypothetical protein
MGKTEHAIDPALVVAAKDGQARQPFEPFDGPKGKSAE